MVIKGKKGYLCTFFKTPYFSYFFWYCYLSF